MLCRVIDVHFRRPPLVQGGLLEIPIRMNVDIDTGERNVHVLKKYEKLVSSIIKNQ